MWGILLYHTMTALHKIFVNPKNQKRKVSNAELVIGERFVEFQFLSERAERIIRVFPIKRGKHKQSALERGGPRHEAGPLCLS